MFIYICDLTFKIHKYEKLKKLSRNELKTVKGSKACSQWYNIYSGCGKDYSLCGDNYATIGDMHDAMNEFNKIKCG